MAKKSVTKNYIYNLIYQILIIILPIITTPYVSRVLGAENIGIYSYTLSIVTYFILFGSLGISLYGQKEIAYVQDNKKEYSKKFWEIQLLKSFTMIISLTCYYFVFVLRPNENHIYFFILMFEILGNLLDISWFFQGLEEFKKTVIRNLTIKLLSVACIFIFIKESNDLIKYFIIYVVSTILGNLSLWLYLPKFLCKVKIKNINILKHVKPTIALFIPQIAIQVYTLLDKTMIGAITGDMAEVGIYEQGSKIVKIVLTLVTSMGTVVIPRIANLYASKNKKEIVERLNKSFRFVWFLGFPLMCGLIGVANNFVPWFLGEDFSKAIQIIQIGSLLIMAIGLNNVSGMQYLIPVGRQNDFTKSVVIGAIVNFLGNLIFINIAGAIGAIIFSVIAEFVIFIVQLFMIKDTIKVKNVFKNSVHYILASLIMLVIILPLSYILPSTILSTAIIVIIGTAIYLTSLVIYKDDMLFRIFNKIKNVFRRKN